MLNKIQDKYEYTATTEVNNNEATLSVYFDSMGYPSSIGCPKDLSELKFAEIMIEDMNEDMEYGNSEQEDEIIRRAIDWLKQSINEKNEKTDRPSIPYNIDNLWHTENSKGDGEDFQPEGRGDFDVNEIETLCPIATESRELELICRSYTDCDTAIYADDKNQMFVVISNSGWGQEIPYSECR